MKKYFIFATALAALASCSSDDFVGESPNGVNGQIDGAISFNMNVPAVTRADKTGSAAATDLGNYFIVYGEKGETSKDKYTAGNLVFPNYTVHYTASSAYTTTSNTKNWEYVGETPISTANVKMNDGENNEAAPADQTIKYWDYGAATYTFTAVSANKGDIENGRVVIQKNTTGASNVYQKGYTITLAKSGDVGSYTYPTINKLFIADREVISKGTGTDRDAPNAYGGNVTMKFRNFMSHIRAGVYETIPGYDITAISFFVDDGAGNQTTLAKVESTNAFGAKCPNISTTDYEGTISVTYYESGAVLNQPKVSATGTPATNLILGTNMSTISDATDNQLGKTATSPTWDQAAGAFTEVIPQVENATNLKLKCNYTLWNSITKETITVEGATAEVPAKYLQWKSNYNYTYLFKISDNTNGSSGTPGTDPAGLYPITFDALEVMAADGQAEYITTVSEPSITTFGAIFDNTNKFKNYTTGGNEYQIPSGTYYLNIYATFMEGNTVKTPVHGTSGAQHVNVYTVTTPDATNFPITEASVAESIANGPSSITNSVWTFDGTSTYTAVENASALVAGTTYYKSDGSKNPGETGYTQTVAVLGTDYKIASKVTCTAYTTNVSVVTTVPGEDGVDITIDAIKLGSIAAGTYAIEYEASSAWTGTYKKVYKIINVVAAGGGGGGARLAK